MDRSYAYGDELAGTSITAEYKNTGQIRDPSGLDHFAMRAYASSLGRWLTPDPSGLAAVDPNNPQTWNRYAYVLNDPASNLDPLGLGTPTGGRCPIIPTGPVCYIVNACGTPIGTPDPGVSPGMDIETELNSARVSPACGAAR